MLSQTAAGTAYVDSDGRQVIVLNMRSVKRRTHAAERTNGTRKGAGSRRNRRTGYAGRAQQFRAFGCKIRAEFWAAYNLALDDMITGGNPAEEQRLRGLLDTLPDGHLELRGTFS